MQNLHRHSYYSNIFVSDSVASNEDYARRAVELGHGVLSSVEHGWQGNYFQTYELAKKYGLKPVIGAEAYWVKDRLKEYPVEGKDTLAKDKSNHHILLLAKSNMGREAINDVLSEANISGYYYRPRVDLELLMSLPPKDVMITTACIAFSGYEDVDDVILSLQKRFEGNFFLEQQYHDTDRQREWSRHLLRLHQQYGIPMTVGLDSHYIFPYDKALRDCMLVAKNVRYDDEDGWFMDYPNDYTVVERFLKQGVLNEEQIKEAMDNTDIVLDFCDYEGVRIFIHDIKLPSLFPNETKEEKNRRYSRLISKKFKEYMKGIPNEDYDRYFEGIKAEIQTYKDTGMVDYPLLDYAIVNDAIEHGGLITSTGRGCFTKEALVHTKKGLKFICDVEVGDFVVDMHGTFKSVVDTMSYVVTEDLIKINYLYGSNEKYPNICTKDHLILIKRNNEIGWVQAQHLTKNDYVCLPKMQLEDNHQDIIDLNDYNIFGYNYDDDYIYEYSPFINNKYDYSPRELSRVFGVSKKLMEDFANGVKNDFRRKPGLLEKIFHYLPFKSIEEYRAYIKDMRTIKIRRYIHLDYMFGQFVGLMYGDGCNRIQSNEISLAINRMSHKTLINRKIFQDIADMFGVKVHCHSSKNRQLDQLGLRSKLISYFVSKFMFVSKRNKIKQFNENLFDYPNIFKQGIVSGLFLSDGSDSEVRKSFDNTSLSLVNAYKLIQMANNDGIMSIAVRMARKDNRRYNGKESYKIRHAINPLHANKICERCLEDEKYWYLPIKETTILPNQNTTVYDLTIHDSHSYLVYNMIVHNSAVGFMTNTLCGFSKVDRFKSNIKLYPERFISTTRILATKSLPDIDLNVGNPEVFEESQKRILGENHVAPMIAFGTLKKKSAFKLYARANNMDFDLANEISRQIEKYDEAVKNASDDERDQIDLYDYVDKKYEEYIEYSKNYWGVISDKKKAPSAYLLYDGDIRREIGLIKCKSDSTKKEYITCVIDGAVAENYKFLKNDILKVDVVLLIDKVFKRIGIEPFNVNELIERVRDDEKVWGLYAKGFTIGLNQVEQEGSRKKCMAYKPRNVSELSAFVAAIRPGFKSMYDRFEKREDFSWGIPSLDNLLRTEELPVSFLFFQEQVMSVLNFAGFPMDECYGMIKAIAKKHPEKVRPLRAKFIEGFKERLIADEGMEEQEARKSADDVWTIISDNCNYGFNSAHAYCMALDSLYQAWQKANYPYEFYEVLLRHYSEKGNKDKVFALKDEMKRAFDIDAGEYKFGLDNRQFMADKDNGRILSDLSSIKGMNARVARDLFSLRDNHYETFVDLLDDIRKKTSCNSKQLDTLIKIDYFSEFGHINKLLGIYETYNKLITRKTLSIPELDAYGIASEQVEKYADKMTSKTAKIFNMKGLILDIVRSKEYPRTTLRQKIEYEIDLLGYVDIVLPDCDEDYVCVTEVRGDASRNVTVYRFVDGTTDTYKVRKKTFETNPLKPKDIIKILELTWDRKWKYLMDPNTGKESFEQIDEQELLLSKYTFV